MDANILSTAMAPPSEQINQYSVSTNKFVSYNMQQLPSTTNNNNNNNGHHPQHQHQQQMTQRRTIDPSPSPNRPSCIHQGLNKFVPQCNGTYGQGNGNGAATVSCATLAAHQATTTTSLSSCPTINRSVAYTTTTTTTVPPAEDVMRWKEFRRRQKMETQHQQWQQALYEMESRDFADMQQQQKQQQQDGNGMHLPSGSVGVGQQQSNIHHGHGGHGGGGNNRRSLGDKISCAEEDEDDTAGILPQLDSLSLSLSDSTMGNHPAPTTNTTIVDKSRSHENDAVQQLECKASSSSSRGGGGGGGLAMIEIDPEGFPISPASLESKEELRGGESIEMEEELQQQQQQDDDHLANKEDMEEEEVVVTEYFTTLDCGVNAMKREHAKNIASKRSNAVSANNDGSDYGGNNDNTWTSSEVPGSEVPTEIISNTARYVAKQSNLMARRMMMHNHPADAAVASSSSSSVHGNHPPSLTVSTGRMPAPPSCSSSAAATGMPMLMTPPGSSAGAPPPPSFAAKEHDDSKLQQQPQSSKSAASKRLKLAATPAGETTPSSAAFTPAAPFLTPGWDSIHPTVANDMLERVFATPKEEEDGGEGVSPPTSPWMEPMLENDENNAKDVSTVGSDWDPLHVSTIREDDDYEEDANDDGAVVASPLSAKSKSSQQSEHNVPTLDEVNSFMSQLKQLRRENSASAASKQKQLNHNNNNNNNNHRSLSSSSSSSLAAPIEGFDYLPAGSEHDVILKEENVEFAKSLMERKERLRKHKAESDRKKKEFDERLQAIRSKVYDDGSDEEDGGESKTSMLPGVDVTPVKMTTPVVATKTTLNRHNEGSDCFPTDEKEARLPPVNNAAAIIGGQMQGQQSRSMPFSPMVPGARWSGGLARWGSPSNSNNTANTKSAPSQPSPAQKKLNIAVDEDDFSFKPPSVIAGGTHSIAISPIVAGGGSTSMQNRFSFAPSPEDDKKKKSSPMGAILNTIGNAAASRSNKLSSSSNKNLSYSPNSKISLSPVSSKRSRSMPPFNNSRLGSFGGATEAVGNAATSADILFSSATTPRGQQQAYIQKLSPPEVEPNFSSPIPETPVGTAKSSQQLPTREPSDVSSPPSTSIPSPDMSEGDKGGGIGFGYNFRGDKSIVSKSSSKFVELGQRNASADPPENEECSRTSLLGVTIKKKRKKKKSSLRNSPPLFETVDEQNESKCGSLSTTQEEEEGCSGSLASSKDDNTISNKSSCSSSRKPLDPDGFDWKELAAQRKEEAAAAASASDHHRQQQHKQKQMNPNPPPAPPLRLEFVPENANVEYDAVIHRRTPTERLDFNRVEEKKASAAYPDDQRQQHHRQPPPVLSLDIIVPDDDAEEEDSEGFVAVMDRVKTCLTPRESGNLEIMNTPKSSRQKTPRFGGGNKKKNIFSTSSSSGSIHELRSRFESSESVASGISRKESSRFDQPGDSTAASAQGENSVGWLKSFKKETASFQTESENVAGAPAWKSYGFGMTSKKELPPSETTGVEIQDVASEEECDDNIDLTQSKSSEAISIKELRSRFEYRKAGEVAALQKTSFRDIHQEKPSQVIKGPAAMMIGSSSMIGSGVYLKNREIQAMSSLGSETHDTAESSKSEANEGGTVGGSTVGDGTLDTKKVLRYAKKLERRGQQQAIKENESNSFENIEKKDTNNSTKENHHVVKATTTVYSNTAAATASNNDVDLSTTFTSPVKMRKKAFESRKQKPRTVAEAHQQFLKTPERNKASSAIKATLKKDNSLSPKKDAVPTPDVSAAAITTPMEAESPATATSVKDRIAVFGCKKQTTPSKVVNPRNPNRAVLPRQQQHANSPNKAISLQQQTQIAINRGPSKAMLSLQKQSGPSKAVLPLQQRNRGPNKAVPPQQQQQATSPPRTIAMNRLTDTPSPLWVANRANRNNGQAMGNFNSPNKPVYGSNSPHIKPNAVVSRLPANKPSPVRFSKSLSRLPATKPSPVRFSKSPPIQMQSTRNAFNQGVVVDRPAPVQTRYESPIAQREYDDDEEDGITLSPTFSEVSGLTLPTCLGTLNGGSVQSDAFDNLSKNGTLFLQDMSPIARHRKQQEAKSAFSSSGAKISSHPYLQRVNSKQSCSVPTTTIETPKKEDSTSDRPHEMKTPRARGSPGVGSQGNKILSRREQIVSRVRASPRNKSVPQQPSHDESPNPSKSRSQEWQARNVIVEHTVSQSSSGDKSPIRHLDGRGGGGAPRKPKGRVAESVEKANRKMKKGQRSNTQQHQGQSRPSRGRSSYYVDAQNEDKGNSLATPDCIRID